MALTREAAARRGVKRTPRAMSPFIARLAQRHDPIAMSPLAFKPQRHPLDNRAAFQQ